MSSSLSDIISPAGWEEWNSSTPNIAHVLLAEYANTGDGSATTDRVSWSTQLTATSVESYTIDKILGSDYLDLGRCGVLDLNSGWGSEGVVLAALGRGMDDPNRDPRRKAVHSHCASETFQWGNN